MSHKYGGIIGLQLGSVNTIVISDPNLVKETLVQKGEIYSSRKHSEMFSLALRSNNDIVVHAYDDRWRVLRKLAHQQLFIKSKLQMREHLIYGEVNQLVALFHKESIAGKMVRKVVEFTNSWTDRTWK